MCCYIIACKSKQLCCTPVYLWKFERTNESAYLSYAQVGIVIFTSTIARNSRVNIRLPIKWLVTLTVLYCFSRTLYNAQNGSLTGETFIRRKIRTIKNLKTRTSTISMFATVSYSATSTQSRQQNCAKLDSAYSRIVCSKTIWT